MDSVSVLTVQTKQLWRMNLCSNNIISPAHLVCFCCKSTIQWVLTMGNEAQGEVFSGGRQATDLDATQHDYLKHWCILSHNGDCDALPQEEEEPEHNLDQS